MLILSMLWRWLFIITPLLFGQTQYPTDSLLISKSIPLTNKIGMIPIAAWQRLSYNTDLLNCQFYPSCSNYGAQSIREYGLFRGSVITSERIVRCNPFALNYHLEANDPFRASDGRLIDYLNPYVGTLKINKSPLFASFLSALIPGLGRIYGGRTWDGVLGIWTMYLAGSTAYYSVRNQHSISGPIFGTIALIVYFGEIYGGWRTVKYYQKKKLNKENKP